LGIVDGYTVASYDYYYTIFNKLFNANIELVYGTVYDSRYGTKDKTGKTYYKYLFGTTTSGDEYFDGMKDGYKYGNDGFAEGLNANRYNQSNQPNFSNKCFIPNNGYTYIDDNNILYDDISLNKYDPSGNGYLKGYTFYNGIYKGISDCLTDFSNNKYILELPPDDISIFSYVYPYSDNIIYSRVTTVNNNSYNIIGIKEYYLGFIIGYYITFQGNLNGIYMLSTYNFFQTQYWLNQKYEYISLNSPFSFNGIFNYDPNKLYGYDKGYVNAYIQFNNGKNKAIIDFGNKIISNKYNYSPDLTYNYFIGSNMYTSSAITPTIINPYEQGYSYGMGEMIGQYDKRNGATYGWGNGITNPDQTTYNNGYLYWFVLPSDRNYSYSNGMFYGLYNYQIYGVTSTNTGVPVLTQQTFYKNHYPH